MWADIQYPLVGILQTQNMVILPVLIYKFNTILKINSNTFLMELDNLLSNYQGEPRQI